MNNTLSLSDIENRYSFFVMVDLSTQNPNELYVMGNYKLIYKQYGKCTSLYIENGETHQQMHVHDILFKNCDQDLTNVMPGFLYLAYMHSPKARPFLSSMAYQSIITLYAIEHHLDLEFNN